MWKDTVFKELSKKVNSEISNVQTNQAAHDLEQSPDKQCDKIIPNFQPPNPKQQEIAALGISSASCLAWKKQPRHVQQLSITCSSQKKNSMYVRQHTPKYGLSSPRNYSPVHSNNSNSSKDINNSPKCDQNINEDIIPTSIDGAPIGDICQILPMKLLNVCNWQKQN